MAEGRSTLENTEVVWMVLPLRQRPGMAVAAFGIVLAVGVLVAIIAGDWIWGALAVVFLMSTLSRFYLSSRITLSRAGVCAEFPLRTRRASWDEIEWVRHDDRAALFRLRKRARFRGAEFTILFGDSGAEAIQGLNLFAPDGVVQERGRSKEPAT